MLTKGLGAAVVAAMLLAPNAIAGPVNINSADAKTLARELRASGWQRPKRSSAIARRRAVQERG